MVESRGTDGTGTVRMWGHRSPCCTGQPPPREAVWWFLGQGDMLLAYDPALVLLGVCPKELEMYIHMDVYSIFILNCQNLKAPRCPSVSGWINKVWSIQTVSQ